MSDETKIQPEKSYIKNCTFDNVTNGQGASFVVPDEFNGWCPGRCKNGDRCILATLDGVAIMAIERYNELIAMEQKEKSSQETE